MTLDELRTAVEQQKALMGAVATGGPRADGPGAVRLRSDPEPESRASRVGFVHEPRRRLACVATTSTNRGRRSMLRSRRSKSGHATHAPRLTTRGRSPG